VKILKVKSKDILTSAKDKLQQADRLQQLNVQVFNTLKGMIEEDIEKLEADIEKGP
jgi:hypothetical protein